MQSYNGQFLRRKEMEVFGVTCRGDDVSIHVSVVIINPAGVQIGNGVRIEPFCLLSAGGGIRLGDHIHIGSHCSLIGGAGIALPADGASAAKKWNCGLKPRQDISCTDEQG